MASSPLLHITNDVPQSWSCLLPGSTFSKLPGWEQFGILIGHRILSASSLPLLLYICTPLRDWRWEVREFLKALCCWGTYPYHEKQYCCAEHNCCFTDYIWTQNTFSNKRSGKSLNSQTMLRVTVTSLGWNIVCQDHLEVKMCLISDYI